MPSESLVARLENAFDPEVKVRGRTYYTQSLVQSLWLDDKVLSAEVRGAQVYTVTIKRRPKDPGSCECEAFKRLGPCKHMWAAILEAEFRGYVWGLTKMMLKTTGTSVGYVREEPEPEEAGPEEWELRMGRIAARAVGGQRDPWEELEGQQHQLVYGLDLLLSHDPDDPLIRIRRRKRLKSGGWGALRDVSLSQLREEIQLEPQDRRILAILGQDTNPNAKDVGHWSAHSSARFRLIPALTDDLLQSMAATGRLEWVEDEASGAIEWDADQAWFFQLALDEGENDDFELSGVMGRGEEHLDLERVRHVLSSGHFLCGDTLMRFEPVQLLPWLLELVRSGSLSIPKGDEELLRTQLAKLDAGLLTGRQGTLAAVQGVPVPRLFIEPGESSRARCQLSFLYGEDLVVKPEDPVRPLQGKEGGEPLLRDMQAEQEYLSTYLRIGGQRSQEDREERSHGSVSASQIPRIVGHLLERGWMVEAEGHRMRRSTGQWAAVATGADWFELKGGLEFGDQTASFPELLKAIQQKAPRVKLGDGSFGVLPEAWLASWGLIELAEGEEGDSLRFRPNQGWMLDALLAERDRVQFDESFQGLRQRLADVHRVEPLLEPDAFQGELRPYQRDALGWFQFLRELGFGGCLADDMGLGKTVQVLALLESRRLQARQSEGGARPFLVVAPRSLVFNWIDEARRFTPELRTFDYTGTGRVERLREAGQVDLLVTTYGTLRRDAIDLAEQRFDYVILDEATAIKNASSQAAKAARLLNADHRLALSGTPIENHVGELWSLFEFLNPGMLGRSSLFQRWSDREDGGTEDLARAIRPFFLRRTKAEVLVDLPTKTEQIVRCELGPAERKRYDDLKAHYRQSLLAKADASAAEGKGLGGMKIHVLEALLRLRQSACHPGLANPELAGEDSAKLEVLIPRLEQLAEEGHKVLVFSQFTTLLGIVRDRLDKAEITYEYLDGKTRKRKEKVERFQTDPDCPVFLISLKAGGHGLNLTASDYVFLLDPWWNPAIEAQAVDRAHRMGQTRPVFAYRLIAKDTVEERVIELQESKRELAGALLGDGKGVLKGLTRGDLERLLG